MQIILSLLLFVLGHVVFLAAALWLENTTIMLVGVALTICGMVISPVRSVENGDSGHRGAL